MFLINTALENISIGTAGLVALLGYAVVFVGLIALMIVVMVMGKIMVARNTSKQAAPAASAPAARSHLRPVRPANASSITSPTATPPS